MAEDLTANEASAPVAATSDPTPAEPDHSEPDHGELRRQMLAQFEQWLDETLSGEPPPRGLPEHFLAQSAGMNGHLLTGEQAEPDLYSLFSALTGLTGEIKLQGRAFKQLTDLLAPLAEAPGLLGRLHEAQLETAASIETLSAQSAESGEGEGPPVEFKRVCDVIIDLYDRLQRGLQTCDDGIQSIQGRQKRSWLHRLPGQTQTADQAVASVQAIHDAAAMTLARLQSALQDWGVQRIGRIGEAFAPDRMTAVEARADQNSQPGTVLLVNRSGYAVHGVVMATAQVTVSKDAG